MKYKNEDKILHDEYFGDQPSAAYLLAVRLVLLCIMSAAFVMIFCDVYGYQRSIFVPAGIAAAASGIVYILASLFPAPLIYGSVTVASAGIAWVLREKIIGLAPYLWDHLMLKLDSRLVKTSGFLIDPAHAEGALSVHDKAMMTDAFFWAAVILSVIISVLFTAAVRTRFRLSVPVAAVTLLTAPAVAAEIAGFVPSFILFVVCVFGFEAIYSSYELDGGFIYGSLTAMHISEFRADREYRKRTGRLMLAKKADSDTVRYHRYSGNMIAMTAVAAFAFFGAAELIPEGMGLDYKQVFDAVTSFGNEAADTVGDIFGLSLGRAETRGYFSADTYGEISESISLLPPSDSDRPVLEVVLSRNDIPVYLRGDIGVDYKNNAWSSVTSVNDEYRAAVSDDFCPETEYQVFRRYAASVLHSDADESIPLQLVSVKYLRNTRVVFQPLAAYELTYKNSDQYDFFGDFVLRTKNGFVKNYDSLALTPYITDPSFMLSSGKGAQWLVEVVLDRPEGNEYDSLINGTISVPDMTTEQYLKHIDAYRGFIEAAYLNKNDAFEASENFEEISGFISDFEKYYEDNDYYKSEGVSYGVAASPSVNLQRYYRALAMCRYFSENFTYSLTADNGKDMLAGFLNDTHSGHCALFATAMTLALREYNIPARYVTGYVIYPGGTADSDGSYRHTLTERRLHAWTEVYFRGIGWLPFDPTAEVPGYAETAFDAPADTTSGTDIPAPVTETAVVTSEEDITEDTTQEPEEPDASETDPLSEQENTEQPRENDETPSSAGSDDLLIRILPIIVIMVIIAALAAVVVMFFRNLSAAEERTIKSFRTLPPNEAAMLMYRFTITLLEKKGLVPGAEQLYDFAERVDGSIEMKGLNAFLMDVIPIFEKSEFGDPETAPVSEDEREQLYRYTSAVYGKLMSDVSYMKRIFMKISLFL